MCRPCGTFPWYAASFYRASVPGGTWGLVRGAGCVMISAEVEPPQCGVIVVKPPQCDGSTAFATARSCLERRGFRCSLRSQRNGGGRRREQGEMGGEGKGSGNGTPQPAAHLPFFSPLAAHHSAKRGSVERNLPICDLRFAGYGV